MASMRVGNDVVHCLCRPLYEEVDVVVQGK